MNGAKTEFITFAASKQLPKCEITEITVDNLCHPKSKSHMLSWSVVGPTSEPEKTNHY